MTTNDGPAVHVWDLRAIRKHLAGMGLDWDAPAYPDDDPAGPGAARCRRSRSTSARWPSASSTSPSRRGMVERYTARLKDDPNDADAYHHRAHALVNLKRFPEAIDDLTQAIRLRPDDAHSRAMRGVIYESLKRYEPAIADLEAALARHGPTRSSESGWRMCCNNRAWELATGPESRRDLDRALPLARRAVELAPAQDMYPQHAGRGPVSGGPVCRGHRDPGAEPGRRPRPVRRLRPLLPGHGPPPAGTPRAGPRLLSIAPCAGWGSRKA